MPRDLINNVTEKALLAAKQWATGTHNGSAVDLLGKGRKVLVLLSAGAFGASATLDVKIQSSPVSNFGSSVVDEYTFSQKTAAGFWTVQIQPTQQYIRARAVVATQTVDFGVLACIFDEREIPSGI